MNPVKLDGYGALGKNIVNILGIGKKVLLLCWIWALVESWPSAQAAPASHARLRNAQVAVADQGCVNDPQKGAAIRNPPQSSY